MILFALTAILLGSYAVLATIAPRIDCATRGRISLAVVFLFTGLGHFVNAAPMAEMLPAWVPRRVQIIYVTGVLEWAGAIGLLVPRSARVAAMCLFAFLVGVFPANVFAALNHVAMGGHEAGPAYLVARAPFQALLMWWAYYFAIRSRAAEAQPART